ncbi:MAG TPA: amidohydrolase family protein [Rhodothermales bacterium]|nr:amidohydrolase family protein [Rhodothermales bacterium]
MRLIVLLFVLAWVSSACVQETSDPFNQQARTVEPDGPFPYSDLVRQYLSYDDPVIALVDVKIFDGAGHLPAPNQTIVIERGRIAEVGPVDSVAIPEGAKMLRLTGRTVIPGLIGMHDHTHMPGITFMGYTASRLWLASGVTTVQTAGSAEPEAELALTRAIEAGEAVGPTIFPTAPYITGPGGNGPMPKPATEEEARALVREWSDGGATWFKLYRHVEPHIAAAVIDEAHARGRKVTGHLCSLTFREAALMGIDSIEHGLIAASDFVADKPLGECVSTRHAATEIEMSDPRVAGLINLLVREDVTLTSTLAIIESHFSHRPQGDERTLALLSPEWRQRYQGRQARLATEDAGTMMTPELLAKFMAFERLFVQAGGHLVMGPDPGRHVLPGYGNQRGFELLVEAGFTVPEALEIATANGAEALGIAHEVGRVAQGYVADLVILNGDLAAEPSVIRDIEVVFKDGMGFNPKKLIADVQGQVGYR